MLGIAFQGLRGRKGPFAGAFVALAIAAALVMACGTLLQAGMRSNAPVERYAAAPIVVAGHQSVKTGVGTQHEDSAALLERARVSAALVPRLAAVAGVRAAIGDVSAPAQLLGSRGAVDGPTGHPTAVHPWDTAALTPYSLRAGRAPAGAQDLVIDAGLARRGHLRIGQPVRLAANGPALRMTVVGIAATSATVTRQGVMFVTRDLAQRLAATPGRVDAVGVLPARGVDEAALAARVREVAGPSAHVVTGAGRGDVEHVEVIEARENVLAICGTFGGLALLIAMFVASSTIGLSVVQREREVALLRAVAATPRQVRRLIAWEALVVGLVASAAGVVPGALLAGALGSALSRRGIAPEGMEVAIGLVPVIVAVAGTALTALVAVKAAGRRAARVQPTRALQDSSAEPRSIGRLRLLTGLLVLGGAAALLSVAGTSATTTAASESAAVASFVLIVATALLAPVILRIAAGVAARMLSRGRGSDAFLAVSNVRTSSRRFASAMTPLVLTVAISGLLLFLATTRDHATSDQGDRRVVADLVVQSGGVGIPPAAVDEARRIPGVKTALGIGSTTLSASLGATQNPTPAAVVDPGVIGDVLDLDVRKGTLARFGGATIALSRMQAEMAHTEVGRIVPVVLGDGTRRRARVVAVYERGLGFGDVVLPSAMVAGHRTSPLLETVLVRTAPGVAPATVAARLRSLGARYPGLTVGGPHDLAARVDADQETTDWLFRILVAIIFVFTAIAVVNTLLMIGLHRTRELALLRLVGATSRQVRAMARWEAGIIVAFGLVLGTTIALIALVPTSAVLTGRPIPYAPAGLLALVLGGAAAVGFLGSELATRLAVRARPIEAIGLRD